MACKAVPVPRRHARIVVRSGNTGHSQTEIAEAERRLEEARKEAKTVEANGDAQHKAAAWDNVEELAAAVSHMKAAAKADLLSDPLEQFCDENPDADECRVYDD
uniref:CP12 domain-containing protein n=1 Tax=Tetradesmus obliquus TaxID=3088 RepID=A0A383VUZ4_TETOB|eukprot:jgi/Sobl393_1/14556/SZX68226.1